MGYPDRLPLKALTTGAKGRLLTQLSESNYILEAMQTKLCVDMYGQNVQAVSIVCGKILFPNFFQFKILIYCCTLMLAFANDLCRCCCTGEDYRRWTEHRYPATCLL